MHQIWFENAESLSTKWGVAVQVLGLRGAGMWNADAIDYTDTAAGAQQRKDMWGALPGQDVPWIYQLKETAYIY